MTPQPGKRTRNVVPNAELIPVDTTSPPQYLSSIFAKGNSFCE